MPSSGVSQKSTHNWVSFRISGAGALEGRESKEFKTIWIPALRVRSGHAFAGFTRFKESLGFTLFAGAFCFGVHSSLLRFLSVAFPHVSIELAEGFIFFLDQERKVLTGRYLSRCP